MVAAGPDREYRLYQELAGWWPLISPPGEYAAEAAYLAAVLRTAAIPVRDVLDLGSGGGHLASHLTREFALTLVDWSAAMLATSRQLNPGCAHHQGDMRTLRLGREFGAVLVHDAIDYVTTEDDLRQVIATAFTHCRPGGIAVFVPDYTAETFQPGRGGGGSTAPDGRHGSFREWRSDPDPADEWIEVRYEFVLRAADGATEVVRETHRLGAFHHATWLRLLAGAGFTAAEGTGAEVPGGQRPAHLFTGRRPRPPGARG
ncbi:MAG: class I SAM-dependent methyltransferase [Streptosporangiaceae bacterium]